MKNKGMSAPRKQRPSFLLDYSNSVLGTKKAC